MHIIIIPKQKVEPAQDDKVLQPSEAKKRVRTNQCPSHQAAKTCYGPTPKLLAIGLSICLSPRHAVFFRHCPIHRLMLLGSPLECLKRATPILGVPYYTNPIGPSKLVLLRFDPLSQPPQKGYQQKPERPTVVHAKLSKSTDTAGQGASPLEAACESQAPSSCVFTMASSWAQNGPPGTKWTPLFLWRVEYNRGRRPQILEKGAIRDFRGKPAILEGNPRF